MWLLNTTSLELEFFMSSEDHPYAILSHTWEDGEVSFQDMQSLPNARTKKGFSKVIETCRLARQWDLSYAWIDTCCIDKSSSAELTEAINSMFNWYKKSAICFAFLSDLSASEDEVQKNELWRCRWFTRGWTLQELIAPEKVEFYDQRWQWSGTKQSLQQELSAITGIDLEILEDSNLLSTIPVARRMSWASRRKTSRVEDRAYSLLGLFDVNVPLIYGEGPKAFIRLQEEIMKQNNDLSLFASTAQDNTQEYRGCLASSVSEFQGCGGLQRVDDLPIEFEATNRGIRFSELLYRSKENDTRSNNFVDLYCNYGNSKQSIALCLASTVHGYARCIAETIVLMPPGRKLKYVPGTFHIRKAISKTESDLLTMQKAHRFTVRIDNRTKWWQVTQNSPRALLATQYWDPLSNAFHTLLGKDDFWGRLRIDLNDIHRVGEKGYCNFVIDLGLKSDENAVEPGPEPRALIPWAALCDKYYDQSGVLRFSDHRWSQVESGHIIFENDFRTPLPTFCEVNPYSDYRISVKCSVSTNVDTKRESGIYELVFCIEE